MPTVTSPPSAASRPSKTWRKLTAWPLLADKRVSASSTRLAVELQAEDGLVRVQPGPRGRDGIRPLIPVARNFPRLLSEAGVPNRFQMTVAPMRLAAACCRCRRSHARPHVELGRVAVVGVLHDGDGRARDEHRGENGCESDHDPWSSTHSEFPFPFD